MKTKCGAELDEDTRFCPKCGTTVFPSVAEPERRRKERRPISTLAIVLIVLIVIAAVISAIAFLPVRVNVTKDVLVNASTTTGEVSRNHHWRN